MKQDWISKVAITIFTLLMGVILGSCLSLWAMGDDGIYGVDAQFYRAEVDFYKKIVDEQDKTIKSYETSFHTKNNKGHNCETYLFGESLQITCW